MKSKGKGRQKRLTKCKFIVNKLSGNAKKPTDVDDLTARLKTHYDEVDVVYIDEEHDIKMVDEIDGYDALAVTGGDGTLNSAVNAVGRSKMELYYVPSGTLNDAAQSLRLRQQLEKDKKKVRKVDIGQVGDKMFAYVFAGGIFTEIGYATKRNTKKHFKLLAYLGMVLRTYKIHRIKAKIEVDDRGVLEGEYTLVMAINSSRCFGFSFNKRFRHNDGKAQLLLLNAPKHDNIIGKIAIFFPLFKIFFTGLRQERNGRWIKFYDFNHLNVTLEEPTDFTVDGEKLTLDGENEIKIWKRKLNLVVF